MKNIFISSTFRDMQAERDLVQEKVLPALRDEARKYGDNVGVIDLRWGVDTSTLETDEGSAKVLTVCLDEIDRSHPYMLIFLGERYGWIPNASLIEKAVRERRDKYVTGDFEKSVTALEIEYGALSEQYGDLERCIVCFREPIFADMDAENKAIYTEQNEKGRKKLEELKQRICKELGDGNRLICYTCKWDESAQALKDFISNGQPLEDILIEKYIELFQSDWEVYKNLSWQEKEQLGFKALMESKLRTFAGREALLEECYQMIVSKDRPAILRGEVGSGKTALISKLINRLQKEGKNVFSFFSGMGSMSKNADSFVQQMIYYVETQLGVEHVSGQANQKKSECDQNIEYLQALSTKLQEKVYIFIDALDQLWEDEHVTKLDFLFSTGKVQMIASCTDTFELSSAVKVRTMQVEIPMLTIEDAKHVAEGILRAESRDYFAELEAALLAKKSIGSPLYISLLIQRLNMMDQEELAQVNTAEEIAAFGAKVIAEMPDDLGEAAVAILKNAIQKISGKADGLLLEVVRFLAVSRTGLNISDLRAIFEARGKELPVLDMTLLMKYLDSFFYVGAEDRVNFTHKVIRAGILEEIKDRTIYEKEIKEYIKTLHENELLYLQEAMYFARVTEDYEFAVSIMKLEQDKTSKLLLKAITEEAVNDEGKFYSQLILNEKEDISFISWYLNQKVIKSLGLSQKDMKTKLVLSQNLLLHDEEQYKIEQTEENLRGLAVSYDNLGRVLIELGLPEDALKYYMKGLEYAEALYKKVREDAILREVFVAYEHVGHALSDLGQLQESLKYHKKGLEYAEIVYANEQDEVSLRELSISYNDMGHILSDMGQSQEALIYCKRGLECAEELYQKKQDEDNLRELSVQYNSMGIVLSNLKRLEEALSYYEKGLKCREELHKKFQSDKSLRDVSIGYDNMGRVLSALKQFEEALRYYELALKCAEELHKKAQNDASLTDICIAYDNIGRVLSDIGKQEEAIAYYEMALKCTQKRYETQQSDKCLRELCISYNNMGNTLCRLGRVSDSLDYYLNALKCAEKFRANQKSEASLRDLSTCYSNISQALWRGNRPELALEYLKRVVLCNVALHNSLHTKESARILSQSYKDMSVVLGTLGREKEAYIYELKAFHYSEMK